MPEAKDSCVKPARGLIVPQGITQETLNNDTLYSGR